MQSKGGIQRQDTLIRMRNTGTKKHPRLGTLQGKEEGLSLGMASARKTMDRFTSNEHPYDAVHCRSAAFVLFLSYNVINASVYSLHSVLALVLTTQSPSTAKYRQKDDSIQIAS